MTDNIPIRTQNYGTSPSATQNSNACVHLHTHKVTLTRANMHNRHIYPNMSVKTSQIIYDKKEKCL